MKIQPIMQPAVPVGFKLEVSVTEMQQIIAALGVTTGELYKDIKLPDAGNLFKNLISELQTHNIEYVITLGWIAKKIH